jgi:tetratricopeptide (TPR) repeat protein
VRNAIKTFPNYVAAWVMLGQVLEGRQQSKEAGDACEQALSIDSSYLPSYLCLAEISVRNQQWDAVLNLTGVAVGLDPVRDVYAYFFRAMAYYGTHKLADAEKSAMEASENDRENDEAPVYLLLAQIYEAEGHADAAAAQIRHFLKLTTRRQDSRLAKEYLAELECRQVAKYCPYSPHSNVSSQDFGLAILLFRLRTPFWGVPKYLLAVEEFFELPGNFPFTSEVYVTARVHGVTNVARDRGYKGGCP